MGKYFENPFKGDFFINLIVWVILILAVIFKILTLGSFQVELALRDFEYYIRSKGKNE